MELNELRCLLDLLRENGVTSYRSGDLELTLGTVAVRRAAEESTEPEADPNDLEQQIPEQYRRLFSVTGSEI